MTRQSLPPHEGVTLPQLDRPGRLGAALVLVLLALVRTGDAEASAGPRHGAWWGGYVNSAPGENHYAAVRRFERKLGRKLKIDHHYHEWTNLDLREEKLDLAEGRIPLVSWPSAAWPPGVDAAAITSGSQDRVIRAAADRLKALGEPVLLRFAFEMDQPAPSGRHIGSPMEFKRAWRRVWAIMHARGAMNVRLVWCAVASNFASGRAQRFYPGDKYVDWIAADGFSFYPVKLSSLSRWRSFREIFHAFYAWGRTRDQPLMVAATGVQDDPRRPARKARWFRRTSSVLRIGMRHVKAFVYWNALHPTPNGDADFWADTSRRSFRAYRRMGHLKYYSP